jgi:anaerobic selenocysteine-containing dehydrogenase
LGCNGRRLRQHPNAISRVIDGFDNYNERIREPGGFYLPNAPRERTFATDSGKAEFKPSVLERTRIDPGQLLLTTIRSHNQFNTTIYSFDDRYRGIDGGRRVILMNIEGHSRDEFESRAGGRSDESLR